MDTAAAPLTVSRASPRYLLGEFPADSVSDPPTMGDLVGTRAKPIRMGPTSLPRMPFPLSAFRAEMAESRRSKLINPQH